MVQFDSPELAETAIGELSLVVISYDRPVLTAFSLSSQVHWLPVRRPSSGHYFCQVSECWWCTWRDDGRRRANRTPHSGPDHVILLLLLSTGPLGCLLFGLRIILLLLLHLLVACRHDSLYSPMFSLCQKGGLCRSAVLRMETTSVLFFVVCWHVQIAEDRTIATLLSSPLCASSVTSS